MLNYKSKTIYNYRYGWLNSVILAGFFFIWFWLLGTFNLTAGGVSILTLKFNISGAAIPLFTSTPLVAEIITVFLFTYILNRFSIKKFINIFWFIIFLALIGLWLTSNPVLAFIFAGIIGLFGGMVLLPNIKLSYQWFPPKHASLPISANIALATLGTVFSQFFGESVIKIHSSSKLFNTYYFIFFISAILMFFFWTLTFFLKEKKELIGADHKKFSVFFKILGKCLKEKQNWFIIILISIINFPISIFAFGLGGEYLGHYFLTSVSLDALGIMAITTVIGGFIIGKLSDYLGLRRIFLIVGITAMCIFSCILIIRQLPAYIVIIIFGFMGFFVSFQNIGYPMIAESNSSEKVGIVTSFNSVILIGGGAVMQQIFGQIGTAVHYHSPVVGILVFGITIIGFILVFFIVDTGINSKIKYVPKKDIND